MSEKLCTLRTKGGGSAKYNETSLWTNPSPSSTFAQQTVTLSDSLSNYKYIAIKYCFSRTNTNTVFTAIYKTEDIKASVIDGRFNHNVVLFGIEDSDNHSFTRLVGYVNDTSITITTGYRLYAASTTTEAAIPLEILGLNELDHKGMISDLLTPVVVTNNTSASSWYVNTTGIPKYAIVSSTRRDNGKNAVFMLDFENEMAFGYDASNGSYSQSTVSFSQIVSNITSAGFTVGTTSSASCHNMVFLYY